LSSRQEGKSLCRAMPVVLLSPNRSVTSILPSPSVSRRCARRRESGRGPSSSSHRGRRWGRQPGAAPPRDRWPPPGRKNLAAVSGRRCRGRMSVAPLLRAPS
jgi:hypothetical protein